MKEPADMAPISARNIVWAVGPDPRGENWKYRPWVVLVDPATQTVTVLSFGITTDLAFTPAEFSVRLPSAPGGHPVTGLKEPCAVFCGWKYDLPLTAVEEVSGEVPYEIWERILRIVDSLP